MDAEDDTRGGDCDRPTAGVRGPRCESDDAGARLADGVVPVIEDDALRKAYEFLGRARLRDLDRRAGGF